VIAPANNQSGVWQFLRHDLEGLDHKFKPLIRSPFSEGQDAMLRITAAREIGVFRSGRQDAVRTQVNIIAAVFFVQDLAISGHQHRHRIRQEKHPGGQGASQTIGSCVPHAGVP
jgi:hypothetical protein